MIIDTDNLKALALAAEEGGDIFVMIEKLQAFQCEADPATVLELIAERDELRAEGERLRAARDHALEEAAIVADAERAEFMSKAGDNNGRESNFAFGSVNSAERIAAAVRSKIGAAPAAGTEKDAERLDFMITEECQIEHMTRPGAAPLYRVRWPWREEHQSEWSKSGREAIDAAMAAKEPSCGP